MRPRTCLIFLVIPTLVILLVLAFPAIKLIQIFSEHSGIAITQDEIAAAHNATVPDARPQLIPKIIHQIFHDWRNQSMPSDWEQLRQICIDLNKDWEYMLWTEETSREFIDTRYPWFLSTYDGYAYPVQRVDALRYFLMLYYGGVYIDLDNGCAEDLTPLLYYPTWTTDGGQGALSNNILGSVPNHPFWKLLTDSLITYNYNYLFPYITICYASGQWFQTAVWEAYHQALPSHEGEDGTKEAPLYRIMMDSRPGADPWVFFTAGRGETWVNWDNYFFKWIGDHLILLAFSSLGLVFILWWTSRTVCHRSRRSRASYEKLESHEQEHDA